MSGRRNRIGLVELGIVLSVSMSMLMSMTTLACSPAVGSDGWCENMDEKPKGDWSANEAGAYAKHCLFK